eukprot:GGOE01056730.1.p1 GENE.GGOE01056730.1~~GGOE01056730.1.p1  ORF type:complete len:364 (+),score=81.94 GGOE01056730.1:21-1112(+)
MPKQIDKGKGRITIISRDAPKEKDRQADTCASTLVNARCQANDLTESNKETKEARLPELEKDQPVAVDDWVNVEKREKRPAPPASLKATTPSSSGGGSQDMEGGIPAKVAVQVDGQLADAELLAFLSRFGHVRGTKDCIKEGGTFVFFSSIDPRSLEKLLGKHTVQGKRAIVFPQDRYKTLVCKNWENFSQCPRGDLCDFAHGTHELRPPPTDPAAHDTANGSNHVHSPPLIAHPFTALPGPEALLHPTNADAHLPNANRRPKGPSLVANPSPDLGTPMQGPPGHPKPHHNAHSPLPAGPGRVAVDAEMDFLAKFGLLSGNAEVTEKKKSKKGGGKGAGGAGDPSKGCSPQPSQDKKFSLFYY